MTGPNDDAAGGSGPRGQRAHSEITLFVGVIHDGDPRAGRAFALVRVLVGAGRVKVLGNHNRPTSQCRTGARPPR